MSIYRRVDTYVMWESTKTKCANFVCKSSVHTFSFHDMEWMIRFVFSIDLLNSNSHVFTEDTDIQVIRPVDRATWPFSEQNGNRGIAFISTKNEARANINTFCDFSMLPMLIFQWNLPFFWLENKIKRTLLLSPDVIESIDNIVNWTLCISKSDGNGFIHIRAVAAILFSSTPYFDRWILYSNNNNTHTHIRARAPTVNSSQMNELEFQTAKETKHVCELRKYIHINKFVAQYIGDYVTLCLCAMCASNLNCIFVRIKHFSWSFFPFIIVDGIGIDVWWYSS